MKQRDLYWIRQVFGFLIVTIFFGIISVFNILQFNSSYMEEEFEELQIFKKQIEWAIAPILKEKNITLLQKYCLDLKDEDFELRIFDKNKKLLATSNIENQSELINKNSELLDKKYSKYKLYKCAVRDKKIGIREKISVNNEKYYIELTISQADVLKTIIAAQKNATIFFISCIFLFLIGLIQVFSTLRNAFNKLEDSVIEVADGNLDAEIEIPKLGLLKELTISIKKMVKRLNIQIAKLTKLEEYKNEFLQNITHEIKTPITAINSAIELLQMDNFISANNLECLNIIRFQTNSINQLVNDILCLSELEVAKTNSEKDFEPFNLNLTIKKTIDELDYTNIKINFLTKEEITFLGEEDLISTAISNLLSNAIRYSKTDKIDIFLEKANDQIVLSIKDYGIGIEKKYLTRIFEKFYRIDKTGSRKLGGSGLGLSIVKNIIELHKGTIVAQSKINKGTTFICSFPI